MRLGTIRLTAVVFSFFALSACQREANLRPQFLDAADPPAAKSLGESGQPYLAFHSELLPTLAAQSQEGQRLLSSLASPGTEAVPPRGPLGNSLVLGFPTGLLGEEQVFGGVITAVTDTASEKLGGLKLTDLSPLHVRPTLRKAADQSFYVDLMGCATQCSETSAVTSQLRLPVVGVDAKGENILIDLASLGRELNLIAALDPQGDYTELVTQTSRVKRMEYSVSTLVFDVEVDMVPKEPVAPQPTITTFTVRWYLKLTSGFDTAFVAREPTQGVGFFQTDRNRTARVGRLPLAVTDPGVAPVKYYIKNVPARYKRGFELAFQDWNKLFRNKTGRDQLDYEFVDASDPRSKTLVTGDPRYFIVEWDRVNAAGYGGLGPAMMNQNTGEIFSANVLVQGPKIEELYTEWFTVGTQARELARAGDVAGAETLKRDFARRHRPRAQPHFALTLGEHKWRVVAQDPRLADPLWKRAGFEPLPTSLSYDQYMEGYFRELVAHELGHNVGLRHNFHGNLFADPVKAEGKVSSSVMEYLGRGHRHLNRLGAYDAMAVNYGYFGEKPEATDTFCTDGDVARLGTPASNPECSRDDAGSDSFGFFEWQLTRALDLLLMESDSSASPWVLDDLKGEVKEATEGMTLYYTNRETYKRWKNFFKPAGRPFFVSSINGFVRKSLRDILCDPRIEEGISQKATALDKMRTRQKISALRDEVVRGTGSVYSARDLACR